MKLLTIALIFALASCTASKQGTQSKNLTVTHLKKQGLKTTVIARTNQRVYRAEFDNLPDSVKVGSILTALPSNKDTCTCLFKRIR